MRLQTKILAGYLVLVAVICSMAAILVHERGRMREIEAETGEIQEIRRDITVAQRSITTLATLGEGIIGWEEADYRHYRTRRHDSRRVSYGNDRRVEVPPPAFFGKVGKQTK